MRRILTLLLLALPLRLLALDVDVEAASAILVNAESGAVLFAKKVDTPRFPASTIKTATALYALERNRERLGEVVVADSEALRQVQASHKRKNDYAAPSHWLEHDARVYGARIGERFQLRTLLYGMMISSYGDFSNLIAAHVGDSIPEFIQEVNAYLTSIGCTKTHVENPHGLHHPKQVTTANDLAKIAIKALEFPEFRDMVKQDSYRIPATEHHESIVCPQTNKLLRKGAYRYPPTIGVKTGWTSLARHTLIAAAEKNGRTLVAVLLKGKDRGATFGGAKDLFEAAFAENPVTKTYLRSGTQPYQLALKGAAGPVICTLDDDVILTHYPSESAKIHASLHWDDLAAPVKKGQRVGEVTFALDNGYVVHSALLRAEKDVNQSFLIWFINSNAWIWTLALGGFVLWLVVASSKRR